jgi:hypothetical protein
MTGQAGLTRGVGWSAARPKGVARGVGWSAARPKGVARGVGWSAARPKEEEGYRANKGSNLVSTIS